MPCQCRIQYCDACWDRTLAASMGAVGDPRCPSCRALLRVDFDPATGKLVFEVEPEAEATTGSDGASKDRRCDVLDANNETRKRLAEKTKPRQRELLQQYGY